MWKTAFKTSEVIWFANQIMAPKIFKGCLPQILLGPFLNTLPQIFGVFNMGKTRTSCIGTLSFYQGCNTLSNCCVLGLITTKNGNEKRKCSPLETRRKLKVCKTCRMNWESYVRLTYYFELFFNVYRDFKHMLEI